MRNGAGIRLINSCSSVPARRVALPSRRKLMRIAIYARVSTSRQAQAQTIEQQLTRLRSLAEQQGWTLSDQHIYRDEGVSGASLNRPGLDRLRDAAAQAAFDAVLITAPDRRARKYVHQVLLIEELAGCGSSRKRLTFEVDQEKGAAQRSRSTRQKWFGKLGAVQTSPLPAPYQSL